MTYIDIIIIYTYVHTNIPKAACVQYTHQTRCTYKKHTPDRRVRGEGASWRKGGGQPVPRAEEPPRAPRPRRLPDAFSLAGGGGISEDTLRGREIPGGGRPNNLLQMFENRRVCVCVCVFFYSVVRF